MTVNFREVISPLHLILAVAAAAALALALAIAPALAIAACGVVARAQQAISRQRLNVVGQVGCRLQPPCHSRRMQHPASRAIVVADHSAGVHIPS